jgi:hypothetical protein
VPKFATPIDLQKLELRNAAVQNLASAPSSPVAGQLYYDTGTNTLYFYDGSTWVSASGGTPSDATTGSKGIVQLAGDLAGTAASPQIATGAIVLADLNAALKPSGSAAAGDEAVRALGTGAGNAFPGNGRVDQLAAPNAAWSNGSQRITSVADPSSAQDAATKAYVDGVGQGLDVKASVRVATTTAGTLASSFENGDSVDGVTLATGDRILIKNQASAQENGIYIVAATGAPARAADLDAWAEVPGAFVFVEEGTANADTGWVSTANAGGTLGTTAMPWTQFSGAGSFVDGNALARTGNQLDWVPDGSTLEVASDQARVKDAGITGAKLANGAVDLAGAKITGTLGLGNGGTGQTTAKTARETGLGAAGYYSSATHSSGTTITIAQSTHGLRSSRGILVQVQIESTGEVIMADVTVASNGDVTVTFAASQSANTIRVTLIG